jgi:putative transposase
MSTSSEGSWLSRGYLPHFDSPEVVQHVTFHLADSLPKDAVLRIKEEAQMEPGTNQSATERRKMHEWIDAGHGSCLLKDPVIARQVENTLLFFDGTRYRIFAWVVMPNHVHVLIQTLRPWNLFKVVASWKKYTARFICQHRGETAPTQSKTIWHREYWDRYIRNENHFYTAIAYVHNNPVQAGFVAEEKDWKWSSARYLESALSGEEDDNDSMAGSD